MTLRILPVVEGDGDLQAVPALIRRIAQSRGIYIDVCRPHVRGDLPKVRARFQDFLQVALSEQCPILWVMDYDCDTCNDHARDAQTLQAQAAGLLRGTPLEFVFMVQEFESLFLADHETTRAVFADIPADLAFPPKPEQIRDAKGWLSQARPKGSAYKPTQHQQRLAAQVDLGRLRARSPSFQRFEQAVLNLVAVPQ